MSIEIIIALVSAAIAFATSVANFTYNIIQGKKDRAQKVIVENRIKYLNEIREGFSNLIGLANSKSIEYAKQYPEAMKIFSTNLFNGYGKIKTYLKHFYKIEEQVLLSLDTLYNYILAAINGAKTDNNSLDKLREDFSDKYLKYDWAYWRYIQRQKDGNYLNSNDAFNKVYYDLIEEINNDSF